MNVRDENERKAKIMEDKKMLIQKNVSNLKRDFKKLQERNDNLPREYQVGKGKFQMTDFTYQEIQDDIDSKLEKVTRACQSDTEESLKVIEKIKKRYFDPIKYNRIIIKGLKSKQDLTTDDNVKKQAE